MATFLEKIFGDQNKKTLKAYQPIVEKINALEPEMNALTEEELKGKTAEFKKRLASGETLDDLLVEAFAVVREASIRILGMRHYDVQLIGGIALHNGKIAEMRTGEGKTLVGTLPTYLNALEGKGVHVITVNDYLAKRDAVWMGKLYHYLGLTTGIIQNDRVSYLTDYEEKEAPEEAETESYHVEDKYLVSCTRKEVYACDITYGTNNEFGFDYLRDNMVQDLRELVMRKDSAMHYAVIDEIDSILIDEARTPLIISAPAEQAADKYYQFAGLVKKLQENTHYNIDEKMKSATLTDEGVEQFESWLGIKNLYEDKGMEMVHHVEQALRAEVLFKKDKDYVVDGNEIVIIDEFTGRKMPGRRYSEGLHQAIEAKENVPIQHESRTLATITFQNLFRMYTKLSGMTGTAETEKEEFYKIYGLDVLVIPTNEPDKRIDNNDQIFKTTVGKYSAVVKQINACREKGQPILIGTISVEKNEELSRFLTAHGISHEVLNAKNHEREGEIIANAGRPGAVTLATNMAGRGVDIKLGGAEQDDEAKAQVVAAGGLFVLGTERHESRRIDNQLRGRSARQGDPGETQFFVSTTDDLMRIFAGERLQSVMERLQVPDDMPIEQSMITKMLENAQKKVESHNYDVRKHLLQYDDVLNRHREVVYEKRRKVLESSTDDVQDGILEAYLFEIVEQEVEQLVSFHTVASSEASAEGEWNLEEIIESLHALIHLKDEEKSTLRETMGTFTKQEMTIEEKNELLEQCLAMAKERFDHLKEAIYSQVPADQDKQEVYLSIMRTMAVRAIDMHWVHHLVASNHLRTGIGLRGYGQRDPLVEYKREMYHLFHALLQTIQREISHGVFRMAVGIQIAASVIEQENERVQEQEEGNIEITENSQKQGRNELCACGSGKKYKYCHGASS